MSKGSSQAVHIRNPWSTGFTHSFTELLLFLRKHPVLFVIGFAERILRFAIKHYIVTLTVVLIIYGQATGYLSVILFATMAFVIAYIVFKLWQEQKNYPDPTLRRLALGLWRIGKVKAKWNKASKAGGFSKPPKLKKLASSPNGVIALVDTGKTGSSIHKLTEGDDEMAAVFRCNELKVEHITPSRANLHIVWGDPTSRLLYLHDIPQTPDFNQVGFGLDPNGYTVNLSLTTSVLIVGESESGKSNTVWAIIGGLIKKGVPFKLRVIDPAGGVELNRLQTHLSPLTLSYTDSASDIDKVVSYNLLSMQERMDKMRTSDRKVRRHIPTEDEPLEILLIDELLLLKNHDAQSPLADIVSTGRKSGHIVIALSQLSQVDSLGRIRDLFPQRMCLATKSADMTDSVLGPGAEREGAKCSRISKGTPGVGYYYSIERRMFTRFRTPIVSDADADELAQGRLPEPVTRSSPPPKSNKRHLAHRRTAVYRLNDRDSQRLYIGKALNPNRRFKEHEKEQIWWPEVDMSKTTIEWFPNWNEAGKAEMAAIRSEHPKHNIVGAALVMNSLDGGHS